MLAPPSLAGAVAAEKLISDRGSSIGNVSERAIEPGIAAVADLLG